MNKKKLLVFHPAIAPYRIDIFNDLNIYFDAKFYFFRKNLLSQKFDLQVILNQLNFEPSFLTSGIDFGNKGRMIRFKFLSKIFKYKPDIIICSEYNQISILICLFAKLSFRNIKVYSICDDSRDIVINSTLVRKIGRKICLCLLDGIVLANPCVETWYNKNYKKVKTIFFPIIQNEKRILKILEESDTIKKEYIEQYNLQTKKRLLYVGRLTEVKNIKFLIEVFARYTEVNQNTILILVGEGNIKQELIDFSHQLKIHDNILFPGRYEDINLYAWYRLADYFILPSIHEPFGAVVNEALITGIPVFCSNLAGASCLITEQNGEVFDPYNKESLLEIFLKRLTQRPKKDTDTIIPHSLMPYSYAEKMKELVCFLGS